MVAYLQDASDFQTFIFWGLAGKKKNAVRPDPSFVAWTIVDRSQFMADCSPSMTRSSI